MPKFLESVLLLFLSCIHIQSLNEFHLLYLKKKIRIHSSHYSITTVLVQVIITSCPNDCKRSPLASLISVLPQSILYSAPSCFLGDSRSQHSPPCNFHEFLVTLKIKRHIEKALPDPSFGYLSGFRSFHSPPCWLPSCHTGLLAVS